VYVYFVFIIMLYCNMARWT